MTKLEAQPHSLLFRPSAPAAPPSIQEQAQELHQPRVVNDSEGGENQRKKRIQGIRQLPQTDPRKGNFINILV